MAASDPTDALVADVFARDCASRSVMENVLGKWGILALAALYENGYRFNALRRRVDGISEKMLAQTLQGLERDGLVHREVQAAIPPRVEYTLTDLGRQVAERLIGILELLEGAIGPITQAQARYDARS